MELRGRRAAVVGLGVENVPLARYLVRQGARVTGFDRKSEEALSPDARALAGLGVRLVCGPHYLDALAAERFDYVFLTPGMIKQHPAVQDARRAGAVITSQTALFFARCRAPIVGVTGSSGKSTTTTLIGRILTADGRRPVFVGGNIGRVLIEQVDSIPPDAWVVLELSSFQLELLERSPHVGVLLNVRPNHIDVHGSMEAYLEAKLNIFRHQRPGSDDTAVLAHDDPLLRRLAATAPARVRFFGAEPDLPAGATVRDGQVVLVDGTGERPVLAVSEVALPGPHNLRNVLAAAAAAGVCGVQPEAIRRGVADFRGLEHRLEVVAEVDGVRFVNDSIATAPDRAAAALAAFTEPVVWIAGGSDKGVAFDEMADAALRAPLRAVVLTGATAGKIEASLHSAAARAGRELPPVHVIPDFDAAVRAAARAARPGDVVLLSPGCASYDAFANFAERGRRFRELVAELAAAGTR